MSDLTFNELRVANGRRVRRWHRDFDEPDARWSGADWSNAMCGEAGEAANVVKKLRRVETGTHRAVNDPEYGELRRMLADELGDVIAYADLLARFYGLDLGAAVARKFNAVSVREGFPERLPGCDP